MSAQYGNLNAQHLTSTSLLIINQTKCPFCQVTFRVGDNMVECPNCHTSHHLDCWQSNGDTCTNVGCQRYATTSAPITLHNPPATTFPQQRVNPQWIPSSSRSGCGCLGTLIFPILGWIVYGSLEAALWVYLLGVALGLISFVGFVPIGGPFIYWNLANNVIMPRIMEAGHLTSTWVTTGILWLALIASIGYTIIACGGIITIIVGIRSGLRRF